jgi:hypothetical protein
MRWRGKGRTAVRSLLRSRGVLAAVLGLAILPALSGSASACPNEVLRLELQSGQLPDCRAYELVSPPYKEGAFISSAFAVSPDGSRFIGGSLGAFAGAAEDIPVGDANVAGVAYLFSRDGSGWVPTSLVPPASAYVSDGMFDASAELGSSLWELALPQPEGVTSFYREQPVGTFTKIGPATPAPEVVNKRMYGYLGASADLSHVLFSILPGLRWPFDSTVEGRGTLYEYVGVEQPGEGRAPELVGVNGGSTALISQCGTRLGSSGSEDNEAKGSMYNAISASGERIFFTAVGKDEAPGCTGAAPLVGELFAREESPGEELRTVPISEPSRAECEACVIGGELKDAVFQGASLDGSKVFFTTEQELLPGAVGENLYEYDFDAPEGERISRISVPASGEAQVQGLARIAEDGSHAYFVAKGVLTETPNGVGNKAIAGADNLYVYERDELFPTGRMSFVATLLPGDSTDWQRADERPVIASGNGDFLVFASIADLTNEGLGGVGPQTQVFQYNAVTGGLLRASIGQNGYNDNDRSPLIGSRIVNGFPSAYSYAQVDSAASANGAQAPEDGAVFFESPDALTPQALSDQPNSLNELVPNIYEFSAGSVYLLSDGHDVSTVNSNPGSYLAGSDPSGGDVFFFTADSLIPQDGDTQQDLYDARVEGGFPVPVLPATCSGETCRGAPAPALALSPLGGSATQAAEAEAVPAVAAPSKTTSKAKLKKKQKAKKKHKVVKRRQKTRKASRHRTQGVSR